jgi:NADPH:quinone reductase-like Zn-dependent oxidoreductase
MGALTTTERTVTVATSRSPSEPLALRELPAKALRAGDVRVRVAAIGVNPVDWKMRSGGPLRFAHRFVGPSGPLVVGVDFAGEVVEADAGADLAVGTRVVGGTDFSRGQLGSYATEVVVRADQCATLPDDVTFEHAACLPVPGATALRAFELARLSEVPPSDLRVLVLGASGGVGLVTLQLVRAMGGKAAGVCSTRNVALVERLGATAIDYSKGDPLAAAASEGPFHLVFHCVGSDLYPLAAARAVLAPRGVDALAVVRAADVPSMLFRSSVKSVLGRPVRKNLEPLVQALAKGDIEPLIEARFPLAEAEKAHALSQAGRVVGKLLLVP